MKCRAYSVSLKSGKDRLDRELVSIRNDRLAAAISARIRIRRRHRQQRFSLAIRTSNPASLQLKGEFQMNPATLT